MNTSFKSIFIGVGIFVCVIGGLLLFTFWFEKTPEQLPQDRAEKQHKEEVPIETIPSSSPQSTVAPDSIIDTLPSVRLESGGFSPAQVVIGKKDGKQVGCFLVVINATNRILSLRLGPYEKDKEKGFPYPAIAPGETSIIDPRYTGIADPLFYNLTNPSERFTAHIDESCK